MKLKVGVVGVGHFGAHHVRVFSRMSGIELCGVADISEERARYISQTYGVPYYLDHKELAEHIEAVSIATPTETHYQIAKFYLERGYPVMVEKPMTNSLKEADHLVEIAEKNNVLLQVGHVERFNPVVVALQRYAHKPRFIECHRLSPYTFRSKDIGVVLDLMIHDIDIVLSLVDSKLVRVEAVGVDVVSHGKEDIANARLVFEDGCVANITASRVSDKVMRKIRVFSSDLYISMDYSQREAKIYRKSDLLKSGDIDVSKIDSAKISEVRDLLFADLLTAETVTIEEYDPLEKELESFVKCVKEGLKPVVTGEHGKRAMEAAWNILQEIKDSIQKYHAGMSSIEYSAAN